MEAHLFKVNSVLSSATSNNKSFIMKILFWNNNLSVPACTVLSSVYTLCIPSTVSCVWVTYACMRWICLVRSRLLFAAYSHFLHLNGLDTVWVSICLSRWYFRLQAYLHTLHTYGFSPLWMRIWLVRLPFCVNLSSHTLHAYGFSPVWVRIWADKWLL